MTPITTAALVLPEGVVATYSWNAQQADRQAQSLVLLSMTLFVDSVTMGVHNPMIMTAQLAAILKSMAIGQEIARLLSVMILDQRLVPANMPLYAVS